MIAGMVLTIMKVQSWFITLFVAILDPPHYDRWDDDQWDL